MKLVTGALWLQETACCSVGEPPGWFRRCVLEASIGEFVIDAVVVDRLVETDACVGDPGDGEPCRTRGQARTTADDAWLVT